MLSRQRSDKLTLSQMGAELCLRINQIKNPGRKIPEFTTPCNSLYWDISRSILFCVTLFCNCPNRLCGFFVFRKPQNLGIYFCNFERNLLKSRWQWHAFFFFRENTVVSWKKFRDIWTYFRNGQKLAVCQHVNSISINDHSSF